MIDFMCGEAGLSRRFPLDAVEHLAFVAREGGIVQQA